MEATLSILNDGLITASDNLRLRLKFSEPIHGEAGLRIVWTDTYDRTVTDEFRTVNADGDFLDFELCLERVLSVVNRLNVRLHVAGTVIEVPELEFVVTPKANKLDDYNVIMYYAYPEHQERLREIGIVAGMIQPRRKIEGEITVADPEISKKLWVENNYGYYCDQIAVPYYATYHTPAFDPKNKLLIEAKELYLKDRTKKDAFIRKPSFHDEEATAEALERIRLTVEKHKKYKPIMYTTDECGVADLLTAWDFDFDPRALAAMREWLLEQYGSLEAINEEWGTNFKSIDEVVPFTTDEMLERDDYNLSPWADHRFFMNETFANAIDRGRKAAHAEDPEALSGIVGAQAPGTFGGYDYWLLTRVLDVIEPYNIGNNREIIRSLAPGLPCFTTFFRYSNFEIWRLWYQALHGDRGIIIYNDSRNAYLDEQGNFTEIALGFAPHFRELASGVVKQIAHAKPAKNQVSVLYSHRSITAHWRIENEHLGKNWLQRGSYLEYKDSTYLRLREAFVRIIEDNHIEYDFVAYGQLENGEFDKMDRKVLILPQVIALSEKEAEAIKRFVERGGTVVADCIPGLMDGHCKLLGAGQLDDLFGISREKVTPRIMEGPAGLEPTGNIPEEYSWASAFANAPIERVTTAEPWIKPKDGAIALYRDSNGIPAVIVNNYGAGKTIYLNFLATDYHRWRMKPPEHENLRVFMVNLFRAAGIEWDVKLYAADGGHPHAVEMFTYDFGAMKMYAFLRLYQNRVTELGPPEYQDQSSLETEIDLSLDLGGEKAVYDARKGVYLGRMSKVPFTLGKWEPVIITVMDEPAEELVVCAPEKIERCGIAKVSVSLKGQSTGDFHAFRVTVVDPDGEEKWYLATNLSAPQGKAEWLFKTAASDKPGAWKVRIRDYATGICAEKIINVV